MLSLVASNLFTKPMVPFHPLVTIVVSAYRLPSIHSRPTFQRTRKYSDNMIQRMPFPMSYRILARPKVDHQIIKGFDIRCFTSMPKHDSVVQSNKEPILHSLSLSTVNGKDYFNLNIPGLEKTESDEGLCVFLYMPGVKDKDVKVYVQHDVLLVIEGRTHEVKYEGRMLIPKIIAQTCSEFKEEMQDGMLKLTLPMVKEKPLKTNIFTNIITMLRFKLLVRYHARHPSVLRFFTQSHIIEELCPRLFSSVSIYKKETPKSLHISVKPGLEKIELTREGACISLNMPELELEDVKSYFMRHTFVIEGKTKTETKKVHYITGIHLPEYFRRKHNMMKTEMQGGMYKATLPM